MGASDGGGTGRTYWRQSDRPQCRSGLKSSLIFRRPSTSACSQKTQFYQYQLHKPSFYEEFFIAENHRRVINRNLILPLLPFFLDL